MRVLFIVFCFLIPLTANCQLNTLVYRLQKKDGTTYTGRIESKNTKTYFIRLANDSLKLVYKNDVTAVYVIDNNSHETNVTGYSKKQIRQLEQEKLNEIKHDRWDSCFLVHTTGDTSWGRLETNHFYTELVSIKFADANGKEKEIYYTDIKEFYLYNRPQGENHYVVLNNQVGYNVLYKVLKEGRCMLLYKISYSITTATGITGFSGYYITAFGESQTERYFIYYKGEVTPIKTENNFDLFSVSTNVAFRSKCRVIFADCADLLAEVEQQTPKQIKLEDLVERYNQCLAAK